MFVTIARIQEEVAKSYDLPAEAMTRRNNRGEGHNRVNARKISHPRQLAMYLAFELTHHSKSRIGQLFGGRDHTTVLYAVRVVKQRLESDEVLRQRAESIRESLKLVDNFPICVCPPPPVESLNCSMGKEIIKQRPPKGEWRKREAAERKRMGDVYSQLMRPIPYEPKVREEDRVRRDPCIKCGTRADIGCVHTRVAA